MCKAIGMLYIEARKREEKKKMAKRNGDFNLHITWNKIGFQKRKLKEKSIINETE